MSLFHNPLRVLGRLEAAVFSPNQHGFVVGYEERDYYNDLPGKIPPDVSHSNSQSTSKTLPQAAPRNYSKKSSGNGSEENSPNLIDLNTELHESLAYDFSAMDDTKPLKYGHEYVNCGQEVQETFLAIETVTKDPFDMRML